MTGWFPSSIARPVFQSIGNRRGARQRSCPNFEGGTQDLLSIDELLSDQIMHHNSCPRQINRDAFFLFYTSSLRVGRLLLKPFLRAAASPSGQRRAEWRRRVSAKCARGVTIESFLMPMKEGAYDQLVTQAVRGALDQLDPRQLKAQLEDLEEADSPDYLARHVARQIQAALRSVPVEDRLRRQVEIANALLAFTAPETQDPIGDDPVESPPHCLRPSILRQQHRAQQRLSA